MKITMLSSRVSGFSLVELLAVVAIIGLVAAFGFPAIQEITYQRTLDSVAHQFSTACLAARSSAVKTGSPAIVEVTETHPNPHDPQVSLITLVSWVDRDGNDAYDAEAKIAEFSSSSKVISMGGPVGDALAIQGFTGGKAKFLNDGSIDAVGAFRLKNIRDKYVQIRVSPAATGITKIQSWNGSAWVSR